MTATTRSTTVAFVGLGTMGRPMAQNLLGKGYAVVAFDTDQAKLDEVAALGASRATSPSDAARRTAVSIAMVQTTQQVHDVVAGDAGFVHGVQAGDVVLCMATIDPHALQPMQEALAARGADLVDAPVTGAMRGATDGTLKCFAGGRAAAVDKVRPVLQCMASEVIPMGALGTGTAMKLVNNMLFQIGRVLVAEVATIGVKAGLDPQRMADVIAGTTGNSGAFQANAPRMLARNFESPVYMDITRKDVELQIAFAKSLKVPTFLAPMAQQVYQMAASMGLGGLDPSAVVQVYERFAGVQFAARS